LLVPMPLGEALRRWRCAGCPLVCYDPPNSSTQITTPQRPGAPIQSLGLYFSDLSRLPSYSQPKDGSNYSQNLKKYFQRRRDLWIAAVLRTRPWLASGWGCRSSGSGCPNSQPSSGAFGQDLFLAQKIEVGVIAVSRIDDGGKVPREIVCATVGQRKSKRELQRNLGCPDDSAVLPRLPINSDFPTNGNGIQ